MYWRFVTQAMHLRARRLSLAFAALGVASALATALFSIYSDVERRVSAEFVSYGANLTVASHGAVPAVPISAVTRARQAGATAAAPFLFVNSKIGSEPLVLAGVDLQAARDLTQFWHIEGVRGDCLAGVNVAQRFHLKIGSEAPLEGHACRVSGLVSTGGPEDNEFILPFHEVANGSNLASLVEVRAPAARLEGVQTALRVAYPNADVNLVRAVAATETSVIAKIRVTLFLLLALILVITTMSVTSNFSELVMERRHEIGILKAIGAAERTIASLFITESIVLALASALAGYAAGVLIAGWIGQSVFDAPFTVHIQFTVLLFAALLTLVVALTATALAAQSIWRIQPARILRGE